MLVALGLLTVKLKAPSDCKKQLAERKSLCQTWTLFKAVVFFHSFSLGSWLYLILDSHTWPHSDIFDVFSI